MVVFPNAKINIGLSITSKRPDGFHNIETIFYPVPLTDVLEIIPSTLQKTEFTSYGIDIPGDTSQNLCLKAYQVMKHDFNLPPVKITLQKNIPMGAGMGGGSSDGAYTLKVLNKLFNLGLEKLQLEEYASQLGSDCAFFIRNTPSLGLEKGNVLEDILLNLKGYYIVLVKPDVHIGTAEAYAGVIPKLPDFSIKDAIKQPTNDWKTNIKNDFEASIFPKYPEIKEIKDTLYKSGAVYASMTGSGAAVYGLFREKISENQLFKPHFTWSCWL